MHDFSDEELEITELPEREEMLSLTLGNPTTFNLSIPVSILSLITL
jgi:hypothetical protein